MASFGKLDAPLLLVDGKIALLFLRLWAEFGDQSIDSFIELRAVLDSA